MEKSTRNHILYLESEGYYCLVEITGRGICGLIRMAYTIGLCYNLTVTSYEGRYCFESSAEAILSLAQWTGEGDPPGNWIKHKGEVEYRNEHYKK